MEEKAKRTIEQCLKDGIELMDNAIEIDHPDTIIAVTAGGLKSVMIIMLEMAKRIEELEKKNETV